MTRVTEHAYHLFERMPEPVEDCTFRWELGEGWRWKVGSEVNRQRQGARVPPPLSAAPTPVAPGRVCMLARRTARAGARQRPPKKLGVPWPRQRTGGGQHTGTLPCVLFWSVYRSGPDDVAGGGRVADVTIHWRGNERDAILIGTFRRYRHTPKDRWGRFKDGKTRDSIEFSRRRGGEESGLNRIHCRQIVLLCCFH
ncbi:hypothetical protein U9M48_022707 [Paspalum notatum var. saurae]|uniref:Uncharacterized protein n=1 Tax=Paspalum notatum var. saurae TaxID=547442 RepID=A0AAQ3TNP2_PASNO